MSTKLFNVTFVKFPHLLEHIPVPLVHSTLSFCVSPASYVSATQANIYVHRRPPPLDYWYICFFFLLGPGPLHKNEGSAISCGPSGCVRYSSNIFVQTPACLVSCSSNITLLLSASLFLSSFLILLSCTGESSLWTVPPLGLLNPCTFCRLRYLILFRLAILIFGLLQPYHLWLTNSFLA